MAMGEKRKFEKAGGKEQLQKMQGKNNRYNLILVLFFLFMVSDIQREILPHILVVDIHPKHSHVLLSPSKTSMNIIKSFTRTQIKSGKISSFVAFV